MLILLVSVDKLVTSKDLTATWRCGIARWLQILRDEFDSRLEPIAFDIYTGWLLTRRARFGSMCMATSININVFLFVTKLNMLQASWLKELIINKWRLLKQMVFSLLFVNYVLPTRV